jgi:hypothetical protein
VAARGTRPAGRTWRRALPAALLLLGLAVGPAVAESKLPPVDEAADDLSLLAFRDGLLDAVRRRDLDYVVDRSEEDISLSSGAPEGLEAFRLLLADAEQGERLWLELEAALEFGGLFQNFDEFCTPYFACRPIEFECNCTGHDVVIVVIEDAKVFLEPDERTRLVATLSYDILQILQVFDGWVMIELPDGGNGFLRSADYRMAVDYRAHFRQREGRWRIAAFRVGD